MDYPLKYLTLDDRALITEASTRVWFGHNEVVIRQGQTRTALMTVCAGVARVEADGVPISLLGAGAIVGEMSFVGNTTASATVIADTYLGVDVIEGESLHNLIASVPGFATRFYNSIALLLSHRLKQSTRLAISAMSASQRYSGRERLTGRLPASDLPAHVIELARRYRRSLEELLEDYQSLEGVPPREAESRVRDICDELHAAVTDLSQWEEPEAQGIRAHLYREGFPFFMRSRVHDCAHTRPLGVSMDLLMLHSIRAREPEGDGPLGVLIDRWVLGLPFMESLRSRGRLLTRTVLEHTSDWKAKIPMPIIYVGTGTSEELLDFALEEDAPALHISCIENEPAAFAEPVRQLTELGRADFLSCVRAQVTLLPRGGGVVLSGQKVVCSSGILDRLNDDDIVEFLDWAFDCLAPSGILVACQTHSDNPDRSYLEHILGWSVYHRNEEELTALFARSRFTVEGTVLERHVDGVLLVAVAKKPK